MTTSISSVRRSAATLTLSRYLFAVTRLLPIESRCGCSGAGQTPRNATQKALLQAWRALPTFRAQGAFSTWLYRIVANRCLTMLASRRLVEPLAETETDRGPSPAEIAEAEERLEALTVAITRLTPEQRAPLVLREFEGLSYAEIGEVLDLTLEAVKGRLHRARLELVEAVRPWR